MFIRHSIKNVLRSWPKSALFFLLLMALGVTLCIGVSLLAAIMGFLKECDESYTTIAVFEYIGVDYPDETRFDPDIGKCLAEFDFDSLAEDPDVLSWDSNTVALGLIAGKNVKSANPPYNNVMVAVVYILSYNDRIGAYQFSIVEDLLKTGMESHGGYLDTQGVEPEIGHLYLIHARYGASLERMGSTPYVIVSHFDNTIAAMAGVEASVGNMFEDVSMGGGNYRIPQDSVFYQIAATYIAANNGVTVRATGDLEALLPFNQSDLFVAEGRGFSEDEYAGGSKVCLLPERLAKLLDKGPGDTINLSLAVQTGAAGRESYWAGTGFAYVDDYTITGILNPNDDYRDTVFIPKSGEADLSANQYSYTLGQARIKNDRADHFYLGMQEILPPRVRVTIYDQGYAAAAAPVRDVMRIAVIVTVVCALTTLVMLALFGFLFVYRQRGLAKTMRRVGVPKNGIFTYFLFGSGCISALSAAIGAYISQKLSGSFMYFIREVIAGYSTDNLRYSNAALTVSKAMDFTPDIAPSVFFLTALVLFAFALASCGIFTSLSVSAAAGVSAAARAGNRRRKSHSLKGRTKSHSLKGRTKSHSLKGGTWKYAWLSVRRGSSRSALPVLLCALAASLLLQLTSATALYKKSYDQLVGDTDISGFITDSRGIWRNGLLLDGEVINDLCNSGKLSEISITKSRRYAYNLEPPAVWTLYSTETYIDTIGAGPGFIWTNNLSAVQEFYGCDELPVTFMDDYDVSVFSDIPKDEKPVSKAINIDTYVWREPEPSPAIVSTAFLEANGLSAGDVIEVVTTYGSDYSYETVKIIGAYVKQGSADNIYVPLSAYHLVYFSSEVTNPAKNTYVLTYNDIPASYVFDPEAEEDFLQQLTFGSASFKMRGADGLNAFKDFLFDRGYSEVKTAREIRSFITIEDKTFQAAERAMSQRLWYMQKIFPALYVLLELLAALIPFILVQLRKRESALMRVQGAAKRSAFFSVFWEQAMLCVPGVIVGAGIWLAAFGTPARLGVDLAMLFALFWLAGTGISAFSLNRGSVRTILKAEE